MRTTKQILKGEELNDFLLHSYLDFGLFYKRVLGYKYEQFLQEMSDLVDRYRLTCFMAPRGHGKTTLAMGKVLHMLLYQRDKKVLFLAHKKDTAKDNLVEMQTIIDTNQLLKETLKPEKKSHLDWSKFSMETKTGCKVMVKANSPSARGGHYDFIFADEVGEYLDVSAFYGVIQPMVVAKKGKICAIGTPRSKMDLLHELGRDNRYCSKRYQAINAVGEALTKRISIEDLTAIKTSYEKQGKLLEWEREYMCNPVSDETSLFSYDHVIKTYDKSGRFLPIGDPHKRYFMGADFAMSSKSGADYSVFTVVEVDIHNNKRVVKIERNKGESFQTQIDRFIRLYKSFNIVKATVDSSNIGRIFFEQFKEAGLTVEGNPFKAESRNDLLVRLANQFENNKIILPYNKDNPGEFNLIRELTAELISFIFDYSHTGRGSWQSTHGHDDMVMSLGAAIEACGKDYGNITMEII